MCTTAIFHFASFFIWNILIKFFGIFCLFRIILIHFLHVRYFVFVLFCTSWKFVMRVCKTLVATFAQNAFKSSCKFLMHVHSLGIALRCMFAGDESSCKFLAHIHNWHRPTLLGTCTAHSIVLNRPEFSQKFLPTSISFLGNLYHSEYKFWN